jgi:hypothetical protein
VGPVAHGRSSRWVQSVGPVGGSSRWVHSVGPVSGSSQGEQVEELFVFGAEDVEFNADTASTMSVELSTGSTGAGAMVMELFGFGPK